MLEVGHPASLSAGQAADVDAGVLRPALAARERHYFSPRFGVPFREVRDVAHVPRKVVTRALPERAERGRWGGSQKLTEHHPASELDQVLVVAVRPEREHGADPCGRFCVEVPGAASGDTAGCAEARGASTHGGDRTSALS
jgi:hypothetical protein